MILAFLSGIIMLLPAKSDSIIFKDLPEMVITATKSEKQVIDLPMPVSIISAEEIKRTGVLRLDQVLSEQTGLAIVADHGKGIQLQGFDPQYTMIMIDGEALIGRTAGTLDLSRITLGNIERIEIMKGPSSCIYGSDALAGAINIITKKPLEGFTSTLSAKYGTYNVADLSADFTYKKKKMSVYQFMNRYSGSGYLIKGDVQNGLTIPAFKAYTYQGKVGFKPVTKTELNLSVKYYNDLRNDHYTSSGTSYTTDNLIREFTLLPVFVQNFSRKHKLSVKSNIGGYFTTTDINRNGIDYDQSTFSQYIYKNELQHDWKLSTNWKLVSGTGFSNESVIATRYEGKKIFNSGFVYSQADIDINARLLVLAGMRYDLHSEYKGQLSPKISAAYKLFPGYKLKASVGRGFKAPDFRQLYLAFTNPTEGYSVFGVNELYFQLNRLQQQGQLQVVYVDINAPVLLKPESSWAYNLGFSAEPVNELSFEFNVFHNEVSNLIDTRIVAQKSNGQPVYSYINFNRVRTQGFEFSGKYAPVKWGFINAGYQFLLAEDIEQLSKLKAGEVYRRDPVTYETERVAAGDYGGLFNRSHHMANTSISLMSDKYNMEGSFRLNYRGRYGFADINGNSIPDVDNEYVKGYFTANISLAKEFFNNVRLQGTIENLFNYTDEAHIPTLPGRIYGIALSYRFNRQAPNNEN